MSDDRKDCCRVEENLVSKLHIDPEHLDTAIKAAAALASHLVAMKQHAILVKTCNKCSCRHIEVNMDPGKLSVTGAPIGG